MMISAVKGALQMFTSPGSAAAAVVMQITCVAAATLVVRVFKGLIGR